MPIHFPFDSEGSNSASIFERVAPPIHLNTEITTVRVPDETNPCVTSGSTGHRDDIPAVVPVGSASSGHIVQRDVGLSGVILGNFGRDAALCFGLSESRKGGVEMPMKARKSITRPKENWRRDTREESPEIIWIDQPSLTGRGR